jgi:hypothetical protein
MQTIFTHNKFTYKTNSTQSPNKMLTPQMHRANIEARRMARQQDPDETDLEDLTDLPERTKKQMQENKSKKHTKRPKEQNEDAVIELSVDHVKLWIRDQVFKKTLARWEKHLPWVDRRTLDYWLNQFIDIFPNHQTFATLFITAPCHYTRKQFCTDLLMTCQTEMKTMVHPIIFRQDLVSSETTLKELGRPNLLTSKKEIHKAIALWCKGQSKTEAQMDYDKLNVRFIEQSLLILYVNDSHHYEARELQEKISWMTEALYKYQSSRSRVIIMLNSLQGAECIRNLSSKYALQSKHLHKHKEYRSDYDDSFAYFDPWDPKDADFQLRNAIQASILYTLILGVPSISMRLVPYYLQHMLKQRFKYRLMLRSNVVDPNCVFLPLDLCVNITHNYNILDPNELVLFHNKWSRFCEDFDLTVDGLSRSTRELWGIFSAFQTPHGEKIICHALPDRTTQSGTTRTYISDLSLSGTPDERIASMVNDRLPLLCIQYDVEAEEDYIRCIGYRMMNMLRTHLEGLDISEKVIDQLATNIEKNQNIVRGEIFTFDIEMCEVRIGNLSFSVGQEVIRLMYFPAKQQDIIHNPKNPIIVSTSSTKKPAGKPRTGGICAKRTHDGSLRGYEIKFWDHDQQKTQWFSAIPRDNELPVTPNILYENAIRLGLPEKKIKKCLNKLQLALDTTIPSPSQPPQKKAKHTK